MLARRLLLFGSFPKNRGATFGRNHRIGRVLQHIDVVADSYCQRTARTAFADDGAQYRYMQAGQFVQITADELRLAALFRANARIRARSIDKGHDRNIEFHRQSASSAALYGNPQDAAYRNCGGFFLFGIAAF